MKTITIIGSGMMGSALAFPARENGHEVRLVGTHLDRDIISTCMKTGRHPKFVKDFPAGVKYYHIEQLEEAIAGADMIIGGVSSFGVDWFAEKGITPGFVVDEGGAVVENVFPGVKAPCGLIGIAEKGMMNMTFSVKSAGGHASAPKPHTPIGQLSSACCAMENKPFPFHLTPPSSSMRGLVFPLPLTPWGISPPCTALR